MIEFFNWVITLAYFAVFFIGLFACYKNARSAFLLHQYSFIPSYKKQNYGLKTIAHSAIGILGVLGLLQAIAGV